MARGIIFKAMSGFYYVEADGETVECRARGRFRLDKTTPLVGDLVEFDATQPGKGVVNAILPRKNAFVRPPVANVDALVIIVSGVIPVTDPFLIDRMTAVAVKNACQPVICVNKCDLNPADMLFDCYSAAGFVTVRTSAETGQGVTALRDAIDGKVCAFTGNSGVGKSSILNRLDDFQIAVGEVSQKLGRGRHTTRHVELYKLKCGAIVADTPGFSSFDTEYELCDKTSIQDYFPDFTPHLGNCRFLDCAHINEPGCAILEAVGAGDIQKSRHESYSKLYEQASRYRDWEHRDTN